MAALFLLSPCGGAQGGAEAGRERLHPRVAKLDWCCCRE